jgi:hypothetical protein
VENAFYGIVEAYLANRAGNLSPLIADAKRLITQVDDLLTRAANASRADVLEHLQRTKGNMYTWIARALDDNSEDATSAWTDAVAAFTLAVAAREVESHHLWSRFGLQEALRAQHLHDAKQRGDDVEPPVPVESRKVYAELELAADELTQHRAEPRSRVLLLLTIVICMDRQGKVSDLAFAKRHLRHAFAEVDGSLTLYSERLKANINRRQFEEEELKPLHVLDADDDSPFTSGIGDGRSQ